MTQADRAIDTGVLAPVIRRELAKRRLLDFATLIDPQFRRAKHLEVIASALERLERREIRRLAICIPPRHGKTELVSRKFVGWYLGRNPSHQVILASYGGELAEGNSRAVRSMLKDDDYPFEVQLREDSHSVARWETKHRGVVIAAGVGTGLTGRGGDLIVCDDLVKDREAAESEAIRASTAGWFSDVLRTRSMPNAAIVMIGTRWHEDDVLGQVLAEEGWEKIILPLLAEDEDPLGREPGAILWPERFTMADIPSPDKGEISSRSFAALYQQRPTPAAGNVFKRDWFQHRYPGGVPSFDVPGQNIGPWPTSVRRNAEVILGVDCASKTGVSNDYSAIVVVSADATKFYVLDVVRERLEFPDLVRRIVETFHRWRPSRVYIEEASSGIPVVQALRASSRLPVIGVPPKGSKEARADAITALFESGRVLLPERAAWIDAYIDEFASFPAGKHDDQVDATALALSCMVEALNRARFHANAQRYSGWRWRV